MEDQQPPPQVRNAVSLLWASLVLSSVEFLASTAPAEDGFDWGFLVIYAALTVVYGSIIYSVSRRENWARTIVLIVTVAVVIGTFFTPPDVETDAWWSILLHVTGTAADVVAMSWLFSGAGAAWFKRSSAA